MPIIDMPIQTLMAQVNAGVARPLAENDLPDKLIKLGCEVEEIAETEQYVCKVCGKACDRTEAQGAPLTCSSCGTDFRENVKALTGLGPSRAVRLDMLAVRPDIFDPGGMGRMIRGYLGIEPGLRDYALSPPTISVKVDPKLSDDASRRPYIACAVMRNVKLTHDLIKILMNLQEDLHWALGRDRKLASIGVYDLDKLSGTAFHYDAVGPDALRFVPLGFSPDDPDSALTPREILERHKTGQAYAHLLNHLKAYPLLRDSEGTVLSMPPIINSEATRVTMESRQLFCDVTGLSRRTAERALNVLVTSMKELVPEIVIEQVTIEYPDGPCVTPNLSPVEMKLNVGNAAETIGVELDAARLGELLERMGHGVAHASETELTVQVPSYRNDVMHPVDLIEDVAIAYGYDNLTPELVRTFTVGTAREIEESAASARQVLIGLGIHQVMTLVLTSEAAAFEKWRIEPHPDRVIIENPISVEQTMCRVSLLPGLLETFAINKQHDLPQHLFEVGDCCFVDAAVETGAREERFAAVALIGTHVGYADIRAVADAFIHELHTACDVRPLEHNGFIPGRCAALLDKAGRQIGLMGEVHPEVLESYGLKHAVAVMELSLEQLTRLTK